VSEGLQVEATGETVGEAKWQALRELERVAPGLDKSAVRFEVVSEGERGLLGVGYAPARVVASVAAEAVSLPTALPDGDESPLAADLRDLLTRIARGFPDLPLIIDHLGLFAMAMLDPAYGDTFAKLDGLLELAQYEQVAVKFTSIPLLSREPYPHADVWPHLHRVIAAFGPERLMWGSDQTVFEHDYGETVDVIRATDELGPADKEQILGASLRRVWGWPLRT